MLKQTHANVNAHRLTIITLLVHVYIKATVAINALKKIYVKIQYHRTVISKVQNMW